jgi:hypothetical protein
MSDINLKIRHAKRQNAQNIDLSCMEIESLPNEFYLLKNLLNVNLSNNKLTQIDKSIENLKNLTELNLENNNISTLPIEITNVPNLAKIKLENNPIYNYLKDFQYNWKASVKEFLKIGGGEIYSNSNKGMLINSTNNELNVSTSMSTNLNKKIPFNFNMNSSKLNNTVTATTTATNFNSKKKESEVISDLPKCNLLDQAASSGNTVLSYNNIFHKKLSNTDITGNNIQSNNGPMKVSSNFNKKLSLKSKKSLREDDNDEIEEKSKLNNSNIIQELQNKISILEEELTTIKSASIKKDEDYKLKIKNLEFEIKTLNSTSNSTFTSKYNKNEKIENEVKKPESSHTTKRNWMDNSNILNNTVINSASKLIFSN